MKMIAVHSVQSYWRKLLLNYLDIPPKDSNTHGLSMYLLLHMGWSINLGNTYLKLDKQNDENQPETIWINSTTNKDVYTW